MNQRAFVGSAGAVILILLIVSAGVGAFIYTKQPQPTSVAPAPAPVPAPAPAPVPAPAPAPVPAPAPAPVPAPAPAPVPAPAPAPVPAPAPAPVPAPAPIVTQVIVAPSETQAILRFIADVCPKIGDCKSTLVKSETAWFESLLKGVQSVFQVSDNMEIDRYLFRVQVEGKEFADVLFVAYVEVQIVDSGGNIVFSRPSGIPATVSLHLDKGVIVAPYSYGLSVKDFDSNLVDGTYTIKAEMHVMSGIKFIYEATFTQQITKRSPVLASNQVMVGDFTYTLGFDFVLSAYETQVVDASGVKLDISKWRYKAGDTIHLYFPRDGARWIVLGATTPGLQTWSEKDKEIVGVTHYDILIPSSFTTPTVLIIDIHFSDDRTQILVSVN